MLGNFLVKKAKTVNDETVLARNIHMCPDDPRSAHLEIGNFFK